VVQKTSGLAIASLVLGILALIMGWIPILGWLIILISLIISIIALIKVFRNKESLKKSKVLAGIGLALTIFALVEGVYSIQAINSIAQFNNKAENLGPVMFDSQPFRDKLINCSLAYAGQGVGQTWGIYGLSKRGCDVVVTFPMNVTPREGSNWMDIQYETYTCTLPYELYSKPDTIDWNSIFQEPTYCKRK